jgi:hypothetical protein
VLNPHLLGRNAQRVSGHLGQGRLVAMAPSSANWRVTSPCA